MNVVNGSMVLLHLGDSKLVPKMYPLFDDSRLIKRTVPRDFRLRVFFMNQFPPSHRVSHIGPFKFFRKFAEIFAAQGAPLVSTVAIGKNLQTEK
jgi:hypothetical protein